MNEPKLDVESLRNDIHKMFMSDFYIEQRSIHLGLAEQTNKMTVDELKYWAEILKLDINNYYI